MRPVEEPTPVELQEKKVLENMLQTGDFDKKAFEQITKQEPVVGYGGFLKGVKAENQYGVSYKELAKKSFQCWSSHLIITPSWIITSRQGPKGPLLLPIKYFFELLRWVVVWWVDVW